MFPTAHPECNVESALKQLIALGQWLNPTGRAAAESHGHTPHIRRIGEEKLDEKKRKRHPARRWVVERTLGWLSKCRAILVRYAKKSCNYLGIIQLACGLLWYRRQYRLSLLR